MITTNTMQNRNERSLFSAAIDAFFEKVLEDGGPLGVMSHQPEALAPDASIWAYAVMARYHNMDESERARYKLVYDETVDPVFNGNYHVHDIQVSRATLGVGCRRTN